MKYNMNRIIINTIEREKQNFRTEPILRIKRFYYIITLMRNGNQNIKDWLQAPFKQTNNFRQT